MSIKSIEAEELRRMTGKEGLILQGCGGPLQEWLDGINDMLTEAGILQNGSRFTDIYVFEHEGLTNLLFPFENAKLDVGKLAMWRLQTFGVDRRRRECVQLDRDRLAHAQKARLG